MKKGKQVVKVAALARLAHARRAKRNETQKCFPALSKSHLHNYFADKMAVMSILIGYILKKAKHPNPGERDALSHCNSLGSKLEKMKFEFLRKYHQLNFSSREIINDESERIKLLFEHIYQFERSVVSEILNTGILEEELQRLNKTTLLLAEK